MKNGLLSKSNFLSYLECPYQFYYFCTNPDQRPATSESDLLTIENGMHFQDVVNSLLDDSYKSEQVFETEEYYSRTDCVRYLGNKQVELYEIKSSKYKEGVKIDSKYIFDLAFQKMVAEEAGYTIVSAFLILASDTYRYDGEMHTSALFEIVNLDDDLKDIEEEIKVLAEQAYLIKSKAIKPQEKHQCSLKHKCAYLSSIVEWPEYHIGTIPYLNGDKFWNQFDKEIIGLDELIDLGILSSNQMKYYEAYTNKEKQIDLKEIENLLKTLHFPLYFLDYETYAPSVPIIQSYSPHEKIPFQYSLHILEKPGEQLGHEAFLLDDASQQLQLVKKLKQDIGDKGHVIAWNAGFEARCNNTLADKFPEYSAFLAGINNRLFDLEDFFSKKYYLDYRFKGKSSLKYVLPVLLPELSYDALDIGNGQLASYRWKKAFVDQDAEYPKDQIKKHLLEYCKLDTLAMVEIYKYLLNLIRA